MRRFFSYLLLAVAAVGCQRAEDIDVEVEPRDVTAPTHPQGDFIPNPPDVGGSTGFECDLFTQDCPSGEKCMPWANDGGGAWNSTRCSPIAPDPGGPADPCTVEGSGVSGIDDCERGAMCWDVDPDTNEGSCVPFLRGSESNPVCDDPFRVVTISGSGALVLCLPGCDPLEQDCPEGQACYGINDGFACAPDVSGRRGGVGEPCEFVNVCDPGNICIGAGELSDCDGSGCCSPFCDVSAPDCPEPLVCTPWEAADPGSPITENVGVCVGA